MSFPITSILNFFQKLQQMASHHGRGNGYSQEPYYFFKIILQSTIRDGKLGIPCKFARDYGNTLSSPVIFEVPNGQAWELELEKLDGKMWVQNGWRKFAENYSLELGHFLIFRYQGNCRFHVLIFDRSASEIHYPYTNDKGKEEINQHEVNIEESEQDDSIQIINSISKAAVREKPVLQCPRPQKMMRFEPHNNGFSAGKGKVKRGKFDNKSKALERANSAFNSENPFFFVLMQPTYVGHLNCCLSIPIKFSRKYLMDHGDITLSDSNGRAWSAEYRTSLGINKRPYVKLWKGWRAFVCDNNLQVGDVCAFELINRIDISFRVYIYTSKNADFHGLRTFIDVCLGPLKVHETALQRTMKAREKALQRAVANDKGKYHQHDFSAGKGKVKRGKSDKKYKAVERASSGFKSENPFFFVFMQPAYVGRLDSKVCYLCIPLEFSRKYLMDSGNLILSNSNGKTWCAEYRSILGYKQPHVRLSSGWGAFVRDNSLEVGDVCAFELIDRNDISFLVFIFGREKADFHEPRTLTDICHGPLKVRETALQTTMKACEKDLQRALGNDKEKIHEQEVNIEESEEEDSVRIISNISKDMRDGRHNNEFSPEKGKVKRVNNGEKSEAPERASSAFQSENPFFLVLMQPTSIGLLKSKVCYLSIPKEFSRKYLMDHGDVILCDSDGKTWFAEYCSILGINKKPYVRLDTGWGAFVCDNNLQVGDVCAFELINHIDISFRVSIYGKKADFHGLQSSTDVCPEPLKVHETAVHRTMKAREKSLQRAPANDREKFHQQEVEIEESDEDDSEQIINSISKVVREKPVLQCPRPQKMMRSGRHNNGLSTRKGKVRRLSYVEKSKTLERARIAFRSENPFFLALMHPSSVGCLNSSSNSRVCYMSIPKEFSSKYLSDHGDAILRDSNGKTWFAEYRSILHNNNQQYARLCKGWGAFVRDNKLQVGDICAFELINCTNISFRVFIYDGKKADFHGCQERVKVCETDPHRGLKARETALERALAFTSKNPHFLVVLGPSYVQSSQLLLSNRFAKENFKSTLTKLAVSLCLSNGKSWPAEYRQRRTGNLNARICNGWRAFVADNKLQVGDVCVLEMMNEAQISFKVSIFQDCHTSQGVSEQPVSLTPQSAKDPQIFRSVVLPLHLKQKCVKIPFRFVEQYLKPNIEKLTLQVADRSWSVMIKIYPRLRVAKLTSGWIEFARENTLREGDICVYEMDTVDNSLLKVSISKCAS